MYVEKERASELNEVSEALKSLIHGEVKGNLFNIEIDNSATPEVINLINSTKLLIQKYEELIKFITALSLGDFVVELPSDNPFISPLKQLYLNILHFIWQVKRLSEGDYNQKISLLGELTDAFNKIIFSLKEKEPFNEEISREDGIFIHLFNKMSEPVALFRIIKEENVPCDIKFIRVNKAFELMTGLQRKNIIRKKIEEVFPSNQDSWTESFSELTRTGADKQFEQYFPENKKYYSVNMFLSSDNLIASIFNDITDKKHSEEVSFECENKYKNIIKNVKDIFFRTDLNGVVSYINQSIENYSGYSVDELIGKPFEFVFFNPKEREEMFKRILLNKEISDFEIILKDKEDNEVYTSVNARLIFDKTGNPIEVEGSMHDITERKLDEEARLRLLEELEVSRQQVEDEAAKLVQLNVQLEESEEKLKELNDSKDMFFSIIGHDLKNPFQAILNLSEILKNEFTDLNDEEKIQFIEMIGEAAQSAQRLLENLLTWSRSQTGRIDFTLEPLQLKKVVANIVHLLLPQAENKHINLIGEISPAIMVNADRNMLDTIIRNLASNAIKFTNPQGTVRINAEEEEDFVLISVADNGIGLTEADKKKLFKVGVKNSEIGKSKEKGTGLGLILCKEFVEKHGGRIWVESEIDKGTKFKFTISKVN